MNVMACKRSLGNFLWILFIFLFFTIIQCEENSEEFVETSDLEAEEDEIDIPYITPKASSSSYLFETFDDIAAYEKKWIKSRAKKDDVDDNIAKYDGIWSVEPLEKNALSGDSGLVLKSKAKHAAISVPLSKTFVLKDKPFVVQYEVNLQNGQECGGAYIKLLSQGKNRLDLKNFNDKTPYTIMFGPDKCGNDFKLHFIFRHVNPLTKEIEEKHCKKPQQKLEEPFKDKKPHLYTLILRPDNTFNVLLDHEVINSGNLLEDFTPSVNPPKEIDDPSDEKPADWDEREKIPDPTATKPEDWDEDEPRQIVDEFATKPDGWLEDEAELIPDPDAVKPDDWDDEMDGEWEAPLIPNPKCEEAPGCGEWKSPVIDNPKYKGKWKAPLIDNPNYKGKWAPRRISNPGYFEDLEPFKMTSIGAVGLELWSMSDGIYFDNILVTDSEEDAKRLAAETFDLKVFKFQKGEKGIFSQMIEFSNKHPWIYGVYVLALAIPVVIIFVCCCGEDVKQESEDKAALRKKTDEPTADDEVKETNKSEGENEEEENDEEQEENDEGADEEDLETKLESDVEKSDDDVRKSPRLRKLRKE